MQDFKNTNRPFREYDHEEKMRAGFYFTIDYNGQWYFHDGPNPGPIKRQEIAALFSGAGRGFMAGKGIKLEDSGTYSLSSPEGRYLVCVEDVPFVIPSMTVRHEGELAQEIDFQTGYGEVISLKAKEQLLVRPEPENGVPVFYIEVRDNLLGRLQRNVFAELTQKYLEPVNSDKDSLFKLRSYGVDCVISLSDTT